MYSDRNLINRRNVKGDVTAAANACRRFFELEVHSRVIAATIQVLGMKKVDDTNPTNHAFTGGPDATQQVKKEYLRKIASLVVDVFVIDKLFP